MAEESQYLLDPLPTPSAAELAAMSEAEQMAWEEQDAATNRLLKPEVYVSNSLASVRHANNRYQRELARQARLPWMKVLARQKTVLTHEHAPTSAPGPNGCYLCDEWWKMHLLLEGWRQDRTFPSVDLDAYEDEYVGRLAVGLAEAVTSGQAELREA